MTAYMTRLEERIRLLDTSVLVGLDPRWDQLPAEITRGEMSPSRERIAEGFRQFCCELINIVSTLVPAVKPQVAFFERLGPAGMEALHHVMKYARSKQLVVIADAKRSDIGSTAEAYSDAWLDGTSGKAAFPADALTVNPYLGDDTLQPFVDTALQRNAGIYVLVRTSNVGAVAFQDRKTDGTTVFEAVADTIQQLNLEHRAEGQWGPVGAVVGATWPQELADLRARMPNTPFLVPGYSTQGGTAADVAAALQCGPAGALINSSRAINFAWRRPEWKDRFGEEYWREAVLASTQQMISDLHCI
ncbi:MAG: orotidine-5'-phosphate decarboxylase [Fuerstiella sp.]|nr:orotidine-5'-phosphate decarboxylase [Fuerstiella sp.]